jgi:hypothetical protein
MPCRDYEESYDTTNDREVEALERQLTKARKQNDRLARIACKVMDALIDAEAEDFIVLKDKEVADWWKKHKAADLKAAKDEVDRLQSAYDATVFAADDLKNVAMAQEEALEEAKKEVLERQARK